jgi:hypothetical protein
VNPALKPKPLYAGKVQIRHLVEAAKAAGLDVGGIEAAPDGTVRILGKHLTQSSNDPFAEWEQKGLL